MKDSSHFLTFEGSSTSMVRPGYCHYPVTAVKNVDVRQPILVDISSDGVHIYILILVFLCISLSHLLRFYLRVQHCFVMWLSSLRLIYIRTSIVASASGVLFSQ